MCACGKAERKTLSQRNITRTQRITTTIRSGHRVHWNFCREQLLNPSFFRFRFYFIDFPKHSFNFDGSAFQCSCTIQIVRLYSLFFDVTLFYFSKHKWCDLFSSIFSIYIYVRHDNSMVDIYYYMHRKISTHNLQSSFQSCATDFTMLSNLNIYRCFRGREEIPEEKHRLQQKDEER